MRTAVGLVLVLVLCTWAICWTGRTRHDEAGSTTS